MKKEIIYYSDELNDEFSKAKITPRKIDSTFKYKKTAIWEFFSFIIQNVLSMPIKVIYIKLKFKHKFIGKEKLKEYRKKHRKQGVFIYSNHTQPFSDTFTPSLAVYPIRNFLIVNPENISLKGTGWLVEMLGAIPVPGDIKSTKKFVDRVKNRIDKGYSVSIYPEAHIWPYYTGIRNFKSVSFKYPVKFDKPAFCITNTYQKAGDSEKVKMVSYVDGPFYADKSLNEKEQQEELRNRVYETMKERSRNSNIDVIQYIKKGEE